MKLVSDTDRTLFGLVPHNSLQEQCNLFETRLRFPVFILIYGHSA